jgi:hypothetical protein
LDVDLIKNHGREVVPLGAIGVRREHAKDGARLRVFDHVAKDAEFPREDRVELNHSGAFTKDDSGLSTIARYDGDLRADFGKEGIERDPRREERLRVLPRH